MLRALIGAALIFAAPHFSPATGARDGVASYDERAAFAAASAQLTVIDFEGFAPNSGFTNYKPPKSFTTGGLDFHLSGGGRFGPGYISLVGAWYNAGPIYETTTGAKLTTYSDIEYQLLLDLRWLPDGTGFLFANQTLMRDSANIFRYDFATRKVTQVTRLENEFARNFAVSPDGQWIVFERARSLEDDAETDLWIVRIDGSGARLLVRNAQTPSW